MEAWCARMGITCVVRTIAEVKRGVTPREQYEVESRAIRYNLYKECAAVHGFPAVFVVGPGSYCSPRHRMPFNSSNEGSKRGR